MLLQLGFLQHEPKIQKAPVENESLSWYFVSSLSLRFSGGFIFVGPLNGTR